MKKPLLLITAIFLLASLSCQIPLAQSAPQPTQVAATVPPAQPEPKQVEPTQAPPSAPTAPSSTATVPPTPTTAVALEDITLMFWNATVSYDPAVWEITRTDYPLTLSNQQIAPCSISEQGPTEPPATDRQVTLGPVTYMVAELVSEGNPAHWYLAVKGPQGPFADGLPTLVISSSEKLFEECRSSAEEVLATMR